MSIATAVLVLVFGFGGYWAATAPLGGAVIETGQVVAEGRNVAIQYLEGGILARILVVEGEQVTKGQLLAEMDTTRSNSQLQRARVDRAISLIALERWRAERDGTEITMRLDDLGDLADHPRIQGAFESQMAEFVSGQEAFSQRLLVIDGRISNEREDLVYLTSQLSRTESQLELVRAERANLGALQEEGLVANSRVLSLDAELSRLESQRSNVMASMEKAHNNIASLEDEKQQFHSEREVRINESLTELQRQLNDREDEVARLEDIIRRAALTSPVDGIIFNIPTKSIGAVLQPSDNIVEILPGDAALEVEVRIPPKDIDDIYAGQLVDVVFPSDQANVKPPLRGRVTYVSADAFLDEKTGELQYITRVEMGSDWNDRIILPGMTAEAFFETEAKTLLELLADPITRFSSRAFAG